MGQFCLLCMLPFPVPLTSLHRHEEAGLDIVHQSLYNTCAASCGSLTMSIILYVHYVC
jgi:hypothetical protein